MIHIIIIKNIFLHKDQDYNKMYIYIYFNPDDKFWTFLTIKDI